MQFQPTMNLIADLTTHMHFASVLSFHSQLTYIRIFSQVSCNFHIPKQFFNVLTLQQKTDFSRGVAMSKFLYHGYFHYRKYIFHSLEFAEL